VAEQQWTLEASIMGNFLLTASEQSSSQTPPHPAVRSLQLLPQFDEKGRQTGTFHLSIVLAVEPIADVPESSEVADLARDVLNFQLDLLTLLSRNPVRLEKPPTVFHRYPGTNRFRRLCFPIQQATLSEPVPLTATTLFTRLIQPDLRRALSWFRKGLDEKDVVDSFMALTVALEVLSCQFEPPDKTTRRCSACGYETELAPGTGQRIHHFLTCVIGLSDDKSRSIWDARNRIFHGGFDRSSERVRRLCETRDDLSLGLVKGFKKLLDLRSSDPPAEEPPQWALVDPILDVEYTTPEEGASV